MTLLPFMADSQTWDTWIDTSRIKSQEKIETGLIYALPAPETKGAVSVEEAMYNRRSQRSYSRKAISLKEASQILWAAYGVTKPMDNPRFGGGLKTAPSAGALYPLEIYLLVRDVKGLEPGVYRYIPKNHSIVRVIAKDIKQELSAASYNQKMIEEAPACLFYSAVYSRITSKYGERGRERYVCMDLGHSAENVFLQAVALGLGTCPIGAFNDEQVRKAMQLPAEEEPLYMMPIGYVE
ncbi:MAG: SagB/ThcOx family dehydrogenase [Bacteroidales bacterium]|nr:SagB/ThcOx family dehydrogenase [Bacteroidales bacterium]